MGISGWASPGAGVTSVSPSCWQWPRGLGVWNEGWDIFPCNPGRGGTELGLSQRFSVTAEKRGGVVGARKTEFPWQNHPFVLYYRAGIPIGNRDCARAEEPPRFPHPLRLGRVGEGWKWGGRGWSWEVCPVLVSAPWVSRSLASRLLHQIFHVPTK